ncbi:NTP transferase domain-containing protein [Colwellia sp. MB3u-70]|uniref:cytidylyltransferase domain-containing protein n=1 Tax=unclassified Colwellia TaxID=196834 RepID=UPI0015F4B2EF|nr:MULTISPECIES: glycosyltransferase [unclassified Colwellia]MBA6291503.1 NTP transferase domain-containing protein [Colwellia sp. MB3u-8]MBA6305645.1 NTP transferase domain-containing protein [Colwellia sp. MB3u-70]
MLNIEVIAIIPARGGSKGIPRKNLRPVAGRPMIYYSIAACIASKAIDVVVVSTDDDEIAVMAERFGAEVLMRDTNLADDKVPLDPVIANVVSAYEKLNDRTFNYVVTVQPTSPLVTPDDIDLVINKLINDGSDTAQTVVDDRHLCWTMNDDIAKPTYEARVNRQMLPVNFRETGAVISCTRQQLKTGSRIGNKVSLVEVPQIRSFDIDTFADLYLCDALLTRKRVVFTVKGFAEVGLGHAFRTVMLANELVKYDIVFICENENDLAINYIRSHNYNVVTCENGQLLKEVLYHQPDLIINDILSTDKLYIDTLKSNNIKVVNFEDMGSGSLSADIVINALYPHQVASDNVLVGEKYFCVRDEFLYADVKTFNETVSKVLLTFGGVDEGNLSQRVYSIIKDYCKSNNIYITLVLGPGYPHFKQLEESIISAGSGTIELIKATKRISDIMNNSDLAITSGGRTVLELASLLTPTIVICQNHRETTHTFASDKNGVTNLGFCKEISDETILLSFINLVENKSLRLDARKKMQLLQLTQGKKRVISIINSLLNE